MIKHIKNGFYKITEPWYKKQSNEIFKVVKTWGNPESTTPARKEDNETFSEVII